ncbi:hypothetical protein Q7P35_006336 [Cladosporium inversicolor]
MSRRKRSLYESKLDVELAEPEYNEDDLVIIEDDRTHDKLVHNHAMQFFAGGVLPKLDGSGPTCKKALHNLTKLYCFSLEMSARKLKMAVIKHIDDFKDLTLSVFLEFARDYYSKYHTDEGDRDGEKDSLALLIKKKLAKFLPQIIEFKMIQEIQKDGKLGRQLVDVLADFYSGHKVVVKQEVLEISGDEQEPVKQESHED